MIATKESSEDHRIRREEQAPPSPPRRTSLKVAALVVVALVLGLAGRGLVTGGISTGFLAEFLPWLRGTTVTLFFADEDGGLLVPVSRTLTGDLEAPEGLLAALLEGPAYNAGLTSLVPQGTTLQHVAWEDGILNFDLSSEYALRDSPLADEALLQTLASWPGLSEVRVTIDGMPLDMTPTSGHLLFFYDPSRDILVAQPTAALTAREVLAEYLAGPDAPGLVGLPPDVEVLDFQVAPGSVLLQLNMSYSPSVRDMARDDSDAMRRILQGLMATMTTGFPDIQFLYLDFEGHAKLGLGQCANLLRRVQPPPQVLNDERLMDTSGDL